MNKKQQVGIFSGSFDPIHMGHIMLANYLTEFTYLNEVWFVVSPQNPHKIGKDLSDENLRMSMVELSVSEYEKIKASDIELSMPRPSYSIDTLDRLSKTHPDKEFTLIIGSDNLTNFHTWKNYDQLIERYRTIVYPRVGSEPTAAKELSDKITIVNSPLIEISSTFVRKAIREGKNVKAFLPHEAYNFIIKNDLYK